MANKKFKSVKSKKGTWYSKGWQTDYKALDTYNTKRLNIPIIDTKKDKIETLTVQVSEHVVPKACVHKFYAKFLKHQFENVLKWALTFLFYKQNGGSKSLQKTLSEKELKDKIYQLLRKSQKELFPVRSESG